jgi:transposase-like protein
MGDTGPRRWKRSWAWKREWGREHLKAQAESGLSIQDYCFAYGLRVHTFPNWRRRLNREAPDARPGEKGSSVPAQAVFAEVRVVSPEGLSSMPMAEVVLRGERRVRVGPDFDEGALRPLVALLESLAC